MKQAYEAALPYGSSNYYQLIEEEIPLEKIILNPKEITMDIGETATIVATLLPECVTDKNIVWSVADNGIVSVSQTGEIIALASGETTIYASSPNAQIQDSCRITVKAHAESVSIEPTTIFLSEVGDIAQLTATVLPVNAVEKSVTWKSSNEAICTVTDQGLVTATGIGSTLVTATTVDGGLTANCVVKVIQHVSSISLDKTTLTLKVGETDRLQTTISPDNADNKKVSWSSTNEQLATVDAEGNVVAVAAGEVTITATSEDNPNAKATCKVTVIQPVTGITLSENSYTLKGIGQSVQLTATVLPEDATNQKVNWKSFNESACIVSNGLVVSVGLGSAVVAATTEDGGFMAYCTVTVETETGIVDVNLKEAKYGKYYTIDGKPISNPKKGISIIRMSDGSAKKIIVK